MGGLRSTSLSGSKDGSPIQSILPYILIMLHMSMYVVVGVSISTGDGFNLTAVEKVYLVNSTIRINCSLNDSNQSDNATGITWTVDGEVLNATTPQLVIEKAQFEDSGFYECKVDGHTQKETTRWDVKVGLLPTKATNISCYSLDTISVNCSWTNGRPTNIETTHVLHFYSSGMIDGKTCQRNQECNVKDLDVNFDVAVISSNALAVDGVKSKTTNINVFDILTLTPVRSPKVTNATSTSLQVSWRPSQEYSEYRALAQLKLEYLVTYQLENTQKRKNTTGFQGCRDSELQCSIHGLKHNSVYTINITVVLDDYNMESKTVSLQGTTNEIAPEAGVTLKLLCPRIKGANQTHLSWMPFPEDKRNGKILSYDITKSDNSTVISKDPNVTEHLLQGVDLYSDYNISIVARNSAGTSDADECYIPALPRADPFAVVSKVLIIVGAALIIIIFILAFKFYICFKKSKITEIKLPHHIQHDNFNLFNGGPQRQAPCEQERYDELITQSLVEKGSTLCNSTIPNGKKDPCTEPIMAESVKTDLSTA
ncbi:leukemia inhibitory factor receptor-like [Asterias rubens]|uniref:leukemia inhibitory factor receptor-like n=1 Tax=Asterias rubens TaxID=7604 RepID=UPI0014559C9D|nr:leukemia inhibitory factor receptor-like [Asterias rubens]XP_033636499.1 leukemia inhibitory factor receptor-like [Asterias rubens]